MKKIGNWVIGGIQQKIFNLVLVTIILILLVFGAVTVYQTNNLKKLVTDTNEEQQSSMKNMTSEIMKEVVRTNMSKQTVLEGYIANDLFTTLQTEMQMLCDYATRLYANPDEFPKQPVSAPDKSKDGKLTVQLLHEEGVDVNDAEVEREIGLLGNMADMMKSLYSSEEQLNACYIGTENGTLIIADEISGSKYVDGKHIMNFPVTERPWYKGAKEAGKPYFTDVEVDAFTGNIGVVCAIPVYGPNGDIVAVVGADLFLNSMEEAVASSEENGGFVCIVNDKGHVVFAPKSQELFKAHESDNAQDLRKSSDSELAEFIKKALTSTTDVQLINTSKGAYYMAGEQMPTIGWAVVSVVPKDIVDMPEKMMQKQYQDISEKASKSFYEDMGKTRNFILITIGIVFVLSITSALILAKRIVKPLEMISKEIGTIRGSNPEFKMHPEYKTGDEIEILAESFVDLTTRAKKYIQEITTITAEKERIGAELNVATQIQSDMLPRIFPAYPERRDFDLYASMNPAKEVGGDFYDYFLIDNDHLAMVMADVSGKGVPAALFMVIAKTLIKNRALMGGTPSEILEDVNEQLCENNEADLFVTVWLAIFEISTGRGLAANAGHEHPAIKRAGGKYELVKYRHSPAVAMMEGMAFKEHEFTLNPGDAIFVYTDGVAEATNADNELFGENRIVDALNKNPDAEPKEVLKNVRDSINEFVADAEQFDDITMLSMKYVG
jgi:sigma-B regulation protein RsbU (phosphoserine phosphatase)